LSWLLFYHWMALQMHNVREMELVVSIEPNCNFYPKIMESFWMEIFQLVCVEFLGNHKCCTYCRISKKDLLIFCFFWEFFFWFWSRFFELFWSFDVFFWNLFNSLNFRIYWLFYYLYSIFKNLNQLLDLIFFRFIVSTIKIIFFFLSFNYLS